MLNECRQALRITTEAYDGELCSLMDAGARDLTIAGVKLPGTVSFQLVTSTVGTVTTSYYQDDSTLTDALVMRAIFTYTRMNFGSPEDFDRLREGYNAQKTQLMHATGYTDYGEPDPEPNPEGEPEEDGDG
jgi:hypothetical protein